ncbi:(2Fe-2S)-binding protein [Streptomyces sp. WMMC1477]|uniref:(2Fe-2S)-binding protein n=1 Tax=Streptomyces sp. WMMC1477 TaxID=3015155 RepID=UPI0022B74413|nr:(2Fe-2S)-binding protein [Streptomyces sp. WMMC1477]MCZ7432139.1 (2Fe-2S)-binding protein [Streptomyces sp. WMMC1477]
MALQHTENSNSPAHTTDPPQPAETTETADRGSAPPPEGVDRRTVLVAGASVGAGVAGAAALLSPTEAAARVRDDDEERGGRGEPPRTATVALTVNGRTRDVDVDVHTSLLDALRERLRLTGPKKGCDQGACGACTVLVDGRRIVSCLTFAVMYERREITTVEGLAANGRPHPLQKAFVEQDGFQCGFCTPGQIVSAAGLLAESPDVPAEQVPELMSGNLCRCAAYPHIADAIAQARKEM